MSEDRATPQSGAPRILRLLRLSWSRMLAADLLAKALGFVLVTPVTALLLRFFAPSSGSSVITDEDILFFFMSPAGIAALLVIGVFIFWIVFAEHAVLLTIGYGTATRGTMTLRRTFRLIATRSLAILRLCLRLLITLILIVTPFLAAAAITYLVLLTRYDINYYLAVRPPIFWLAVTLLAVIITGLVWAVTVKFIHWLFALPLLLFERRSPKTAIHSSKILSQGRRLRIAAWLAAWALTLVALSMLLTSLIGLIGRFVIPAASESLLWVALAVGMVVFLSGVANFVLSFLGAALLGLLVVRLYVSLGGSGEVTTPSPSAPESSRPRKIGSLRRTIIWGSSGAIVATVVTAIATVRSIPTEDTTQVTAHRGSSIAAPENTLAAVQRSITDGADWVEIDAQEIADGTVIVFHDGDLRRVAGVSLRTREASYEELSQIDIGSWHSPQYADQRIPTLEQVLELCKDRIRVNIELKYYGTGGNLEQRVIDIV
ncbi:MAG: glycerophosphoryl diester phosphodiesterase membrane domain-containing protein, partial [Gemmatimonadota bacterium]